MKILVLHNTYQQRGGEDAVVEAESGLLQSAGHNVTVEQVSNHDIVGLVGKARTFAGTAYNHARKEWMINLLKRSGADVVHVHNFFPLLSPAVHDAARESGVAVVQTLHNFRTLCASALLLRNGDICEKCLHGSKLWGVVHKCYKGSLPGSMAVVRMQQRALKHQTWTQSVNRLIALTDFARSKFIQGGLPADKLVVKPNFIADRGAPAVTRNGVLFVGRISPEKGVDLLLDAWRNLPDVPLTVIGDGPDRARLQAVAPQNVQFLGSQPSDQVRRAMASASCLIMPSVWYEGFPMTLVEAFSVGTPIIASRLGSLGELIAEGITGLTFDPGSASDLVRAVRQALVDPKKLSSMGTAARETYVQHYTPENNLVRLEAIYDLALADARQRSRGGYTGTA